MRHTLIALTLTTLLASPVFAQSGWNDSSTYPQIGEDRDEVESNHSFAEAMHRLGNAENAMENAEEAIRENNKYRLPLQKKQDDATAQASYHQSGIHSTNSSIHATELALSNTNDPQVRQQLTNQLSSLKSTLDSHQRGLTTAQQTIAEVSQEIAPYNAQHAAFDGERLEQQSLANNARQEAEAAKKSIKAAHAANVNPTLDVANNPKTDPKMGPRPDPKPLPRPSELPPVPERPVVTPQKTPALTPLEQTDALAGTVSDASVNPENYATDDTTTTALLGTKESLKNTKPVSDTNEVNSETQASELPTPDGNPSNASSDEEKKRIAEKVKQAVENERHAVAQTRNALENARKTNQSDAVINRLQTPLNQAERQYQFAVTNARIEARRTARENRFEAWDAKQRAKLEAQMRQDAK